MPCDEASSARCVTPDCATRAINSATSEASGVVRPGGVTCSSSAPGALTRTPSVPMLAALNPADANIWRQKAATEVLPLVPVTATQVAGCAPQKAAAASA